MLQLNGERNAVAELIIRGAKLFPANRSTGAPSFAGAFIYEGEPGQEAIGELFAVFEILSSARNPEKVADLIVESFGKAFYEANTGEEADETDTAARFDQAVKAANQALAEYTGHEDATWIGKTSAVIAVAAGSELHLTHTGSAEVYLLRRERLAKIDVADHEHKHQTHKPFTNIASGHLQPGDRLLLATPALLKILSRAEVTEILGESTANAGATKIAQRIESATGAERVAAVVAEAATPDMISAEPLPSESPTVIHGSSEGRLSALAARALPVLKSAHTKAKPIARKASQAAKQGWHFTKNKVGPKARHHGLRLAGWLREKLRHPRQSKLLLAGALAVVVVLIFVIFGAIHSKSQGKLLKIYDQALTETRDGQQLWLVGDKTDAKTKLLAAQTDLAKLDKLHPGTSFDKTLKKRRHQEFDPASFSGLKTMVQDLLDQIAGLTRVSPRDLASLTQADPQFLELVGKRLVVIGGGSSPSIASVDTTTGHVTPVTLDTKAVGKVVDTAATADGVYLLTSTPAVWLFQPGSGSLTKQNGTWQAGRAIASYSGNLYILNQNATQILRYTKFGSSFGSPSNYFTSNPGITTADSLTIDGSVITGGGSQIKRFEQGKLTQTAKGLPDSFKNLKEVRSLNDGTIILALDSKSGRLGSLVLDGSELKFAKQYELTLGKNLKFLASSDAVTVYGLYQNKIVSFTLAP